MKIFYNVRDHGDGSSYPTFFSKEILANIDADMESEVYGYGMGEACVGYVEFTGEVISSVIGEDEYLDTLSDALNEYPSKEEQIQGYINRIVLGEE